MSGDQMPTPSTLMEKLKREGEAHARTVDVVARILWEGGEMLGDWEDGPAPTWDDVLEGHADKAHPSHEALERIFAKLRVGSIKEIIDSGLHEFLSDFIRENNQLGDQVALDYRFH